MSHRYTKFMRKVDKTNMYLRSAKLIGINGATLSPFYDIMFKGDERPLVGVASYKADTKDDQPGLDKFPIQIIGMKAEAFSLANVILDFDIGICQIAHDGKRQVKAATFDDDIALKRLTIQRSRSFPCFQRTVARTAKLLGRLPVESPEGDWFLAEDMDDNPNRRRPGSWTVWTTVNVVTGKKLKKPQEWRMTND